MAKVGRYLDEPLLFDKDTDNDGTCDDARYLYAQNANWNVVALTDENGTVVERVTFSAYGEPICTRTSDNHTQVASHFDNPFLFQGQRYDSETGLYYFRNRTYDAGLGRFGQRDQLGYAGGMSLYELADSSPNTTVDPAALEGWKTLSGSGERYGLDLVRPAGTNRVTMQYRFTALWKCDDKRRPRVTGERVTYNLTPFLLDETSITLGLVNISRGDKVEVDVDLISPLECPEGIGGYKGKALLNFRWVKWSSVGGEIGVGIGWLDIGIPIPGTTFKKERTYQSWSIAYIIDCCCNTETGEPNETIELAPESAPRVTAPPSGSNRRR